MDIITFRDRTTLINHAQPRQSNADRNAPFLCGRPRAANDQRLAPFGILDDRFHPITCDGCADALASLLDDSDD